MNTEKNFVCYEDFGALGDGVANDFAAIKAAHDYANEKGLPVFCKSDATYRISDTRIDGEVSIIRVKTNTDFNGATLIFDDEKLAADDGTGMHDKPIFDISSDYPMFELSGEDVAKIGKVGRETKKINVKLDYPALLILNNDNHNVFIRYGGDANPGVPAFDLVLVDKDGNIDESTPILFDYDEVTRVQVIRVDVEPIVFENAKIITKVSRVSIRREDGKIVRDYFIRNIDVTRPNTTIKGIKHEIVGEYTVEEQAKGLCCPSYYGIINTSYTNNVLIEGCSIPARRYYRVAGTYGFNAYRTNKVTVKDCVQPNFYKPDGVISTNGGEYWGWGGVNNTKNLVYDNVEITRYDAHAGLVNGKIINSHVSIINLIGGGDLLIENSLIEHDTIFNLRPDYGATWRGSITIKNCKIRPMGRRFYLFSHLWTNIDFGQPCHFPNVLVDNLSFENKAVPLTICRPRKTDDPNCATVLEEKNIHLAVRENGEKNLNPYVPPKYMKLINNEAGLDFFIEDLPFFENTEIEGFKKISVEDALSL